MTTIRLIAIALITVLLVPAAAAQEEPDTVVAKKGWVVISRDGNTITLGPGGEKNTVIGDSIRIRYGGAPRVREVLRRAAGPGFVVLGGADSTEDRLEFRYPIWHSNTERFGFGQPRILTTVYSTDSTEKVTYTLQRNVLSRTNRDGRWRSQRGRTGQWSDDRGRRYRDGDRRRRSTGWRYEIRRGASEDERELRSMEVEARRLAGLVRRAEGDAKAEHEAALREHLGKIFDFKLELQNKAIKQAQEEVDERSRALEERTANRNAIIGNRFNELLGRGSSLRW